MQPNYDENDAPKRSWKLNARLGTLKAQRKAWKTKEAGREQEHLAVTAPGPERSIIFTIEADTERSHRDEALRVFEALVKSFHTFPVRS
jgi:hypothetical protein